MKTAAIRALLVVLASMDVYAASVPRDAETQDIHSRSAQDIEAPAGSQVYVMEKTGTILVVGKDGNMLSETDVGQREARKISQDLESGISPVKRSNEMLWKRVSCKGACDTNCPLDVCSCWHNPSNQFCERQSGV